jgi:hypothetical protein
MPSADDLKVSDMIAKGGRVEMASETDKVRARRLVELSLAELIPIGPKHLAIEITQRGRIAKVQADFGICNSEFFAIEPQRGQKRIVSG